MGSIAISKDLLDYLQQVFPDKLPEQPQLPDQIGILIGQQRVIKHLIAQFKLQDPLAYRVLKKE